MTDQGNLREWIADVVESASFQWDTDFNAWQLGRPNSADPGPKSPRIAQAVIDELGLAVEWGQFNESGGGEGGLLTREQAQAKHEAWEKRRTEEYFIDEPPPPPSTGVWARVSGKWEKQ